jgi:hypothetical protein
MLFRRTSAAVMAVLLLVTISNAQKADITVSLNEAFFDALLDSVFQNFDPPQFSIAQNGTNPRDAEMPRRSIPAALPSVFSFSENSTLPLHGTEKPFCDESIKILREMNGVRTAVRFREGKIYVPLAFSGDYNPPFVGCVEFAGWAETTIDVEFDQTGQRLVGRAHVLNVNLNGTGGLGGTVIAKLIQSSIDKRLNPIEILRLDKISFMVPIQNTGNLRMKAVGVQPEIVNGALNVRISYDFLKS